MALAHGLRGLEHPPRDAGEEQRRGQERRSVQPVRRLRSPDADEHAGDRRCEHPGEVLDRLQDRVRLGQVVLVDQVRQTRVERRPEEAGCEAGNGGQQHDRERAVHERNGDEHPEPHQVGDDHHALARQAVDQRCEQQPDRHHRQEVGREECAHPDARVRAVPDVDRQCDEGEPGAEAGRERGRDQQPVGRRAPSRSSVRRAGAHARHANSGQPGPSGLDS